MHKPTHLAAAGVENVRFFVASKDENAHCCGYMAITRSTSTGTT